MSNNIFDSAINVTQFGWDEFDKAGVGLIQDYLAQAQKLRDECVKIYESLQGALDGIPDIEGYYNYVKSAYEDLSVKYPIFEADYAAFLTQYATIQEQAGMIQAAYEDFQLGKDFIDDQVLAVHQVARQIEQYLIEIQNHMATILQYRDETKGYRDESFGFRNECETFAEEVRLGKVYRGIWNPQATSAYPAKPATNSYWDVVLNEGTSEFTYDSIVWKAGNSLVYMKTDDKFEQAVNPSAGVDSFNGRRGAILPEAGDYTAAMVGAVQSVNGQSGTSVTLTPNHIGAVPTSRTVNGKPLTVDITLSSDDVNAASKTRTVNGKPLSADVQLAPSDVGAVPVERTINGKPLSANVVLTAEDLGISTYEGPALGEVVQRSTTLPSLITEEDKVFLKEGVSITPDDGDDVTFAEAFRQLSNKDGKGWEAIAPTTALEQNYRLLGVFKTKTKGLVAMYVSSSLYTFYFYNVDLERETLTFIATYEGGDSYKVNALSTGTSFGDHLYVGTESGYVLRFTVGDKSVSANSFYTGEGRAFLSVQNLHNEFLIAYNGNYTSNVALFKINQTSGDLTDRNLKTFNNQRNEVVQVASFVEKQGNKISIALTKSGGVYWIANMTDTLHASWYERQSGAAGVWSSIAYSSEADLVYYGTAKGDYMVSNARCTSLDGDAGPTFLYGKFPVTTSRGGCSWYNVDNVAFFSPGHNLSNSVYYRLNGATRQWEPFKKGSPSFGLVGFPLNTNASAFGLRAGNGDLVLANAGGTTTTGISAEYILYVSRNAISLEIDHSNVNGLSNYMRVK